jgi:membrane-anchored glycerophosphoryl diester phosphodiesterase (GDPDase)
MYNPAFIFVFHEENEILHSDLLINKFIDFIGIVIIIIMIFRGIVVSQIPGYIFNTLALITAQQWLEIVYVISSLAAIASMVLIVDSLTGNLDAKLKQMEEKLREKEKKILELESIIEKQKISQ